LLHLFQIRESRKLNTSLRNHVHYCNKKCFEFWNIYIYVVNFWHIQSICQRQRPYKTNPWEIGLHYITFTFLLIVCNSHFQHEDKIDHIMYNILDVYLSRYMSVSVTKIGTYSILTSTRTFTFPVPMFLFRLQVCTLLTTTIEASAGNVIWLSGPF